MSKFEIPNNFQIFQIQMTKTIVSETKSKMF